MSQMEILLVEDDPTDVAVAQRAFRKAALPPARVLRDGEEALSALHLDGHGGPPGTLPRPALPKVIFLDLKMPKVDGFEVLREIRAAAHTRDLPVVVVSSSSREDDVRRAYRMGANSFLVKRYEGGRPGGFLAEAARYWLELNHAPEAERRGRHA